jgi:uncharacterized membrane protein (Fun14 family)
LANQYISSLALLFAAFRLAVVAIAALCLWRRRKTLTPTQVLFGLVAVNTIACFLYLAPLARPYSLAAGLDRAFAMGMAANVAVGNSAWDHVQVGQAAPEPLWNWTFAALSGFDIDRIPLAFDGVAIFTAALLPLLIFAGLRRVEGASPWPVLFVTFATVLLSSISLGERAPTLPFWLANIQHKPNHGLGFALIALVLGYLCRKDLKVAPLALGLCALGWVFLMHWGWFLPALGVLAVWKRHDRRALWTSGAALVISVIVIAPFVANLARDYHPSAQDPAARHLWDDARGRALSLPVWTVLDPAPLVLLALAGLSAARRRDSWLDRGLVALCGTAWGVWVVSSIGAWIGFAPEPDDLHYFLRFATAALAGLGIEDLARRVGAGLNIEPSDAYARALLLLLPFTFVAQWYPPLADRYYPVSLEPLPRKASAYAEFIRTKTGVRDVFVAGDEPSTFIPALSGRRVLKAPTALVPHDQETRTSVEETLMSQTDPGLIRAAARRYEVTYLVLDDDILRRHGIAAAVEVTAKEREATGAFGIVFRSSLVHILALR